MNHGSPPLNFGRIVLENRGLFPVGAKAPAATDTPRAKRSSKRRRQEFTVNVGTRHAASLSADQLVAKDFHLGLLGAKAPRDEHRVSVHQERSLNSIVRCGLSPGWAERARVQLQIPVRARRAACMAGRIRRAGCRRDRAGLSSPCPAGAGAPVGACQPA